MMRNGIAYQRPSLARPISEIARGFLPTPTKGGGGQTLPPGTTPTGITPAGQKRTVSLEQYLAQVRNGIWPIPMLPTITVNDAGNITAPPSQFHQSTPGLPVRRSEEHTSELQSLMRNSYAVFCLKKKNTPRQ